ncbi:Alpha/Beta hydrolase protein [Xylariomycetidae sp. FL2044]|nr:Alpha/Beta hydrolase protein [Xylariomycetidae sp. FL2044]
MAPRWNLAAAGISLLSLGCAVPAAQARDSLEVDVGYGVFVGASNETTGLDTWLGIRYAAAPIGELRWQPPQTPETSSDPVNATAFGASCPQSYPGGSVLPFAYNDEDCLFLNVYSPPDAASLPVLVWIHGGGYGFGSGAQDMSAIINANDNAFVAVSIQYRLGAFGFLSSQEVMDRGVVNAGLLDQVFALEWVQEHIGKFGGDPERVTISGESSGGGSVILHSVATTQSPVLFQNAIAASPYIPTQYGYADSEPTEVYYQFALEAGCPNTGAVFDCLVAADTSTLQAASNEVSQGQTAYGEWPYLPVTDGSYVTSRPVESLTQNTVVGQNLFVGNNANEGGLFAHNPASPLTTEAEVRAWLPQHFPNLSDDDIDSILAYYPASESQLDVGQETNGLSAPYANNVSQDAVGQQQRANNIYAEATFVCPSYWLADAYAGAGKPAYHYQYSVPFAEHQADIYAYFGPQLASQGDDLVYAFRRMWGNFIVGGSPSITDAEANGSGGDDDNNNNTTANPASDWPLWTAVDGGDADVAPQSLNLNQTGGVPYEATTTWGIAVTQYMDPGLQNAFTVFDADAWEAGRGARCDFWKSLAPTVMK